jgi:hypothetical protein
MWGFGGLGRVVQTGGGERGVELRVVQYISVTRRTELLKIFANVCPSTPVRESFALYFTNMAHFLL